LAGNSKKGDQLLSLDGRGRATFIPLAQGKLVIEATAAGKRFYDLDTAQPYNLIQNPLALTALDGAVYYLDSTGQVREQVTAGGVRLFFSDSGIVSETGEFAFLQSYLC
jgi:hypothetical protein